LLLAMLDTTCHPSRGAGHDRGTRNSSDQSGHVT
jgi:hypothetical protein